MFRVEMLYEDQGDALVRGQVGKNVAKGIESAGGCSEANDDAFTLFGGSRAFCYSSFASFLAVDLR